MSNPVPQITIRQNKSCQERLVLRWQWALVKSIGNRVPFGANSVWMNLLLLATQLKCPFEMCGLQYRMLWVTPGGANSEIVVNLNCISFITAPSLFMPVSKRIKFSSNAFREEESRINNHNTPLFSHTICMTTLILYFYWILFLYRCCTFERRAWEKAFNCTVQ